MPIDWKKLAEPFPLHNDSSGQSGVGFKPQTVKGERAMAVPYIDARDVMDRFDEVVGPANWKCELIPVADGNFLCTISVKVDGEWVSKQDVGGPSDQPDSGDRFKSAASDAFKRAAVHFGVGRYLYKIPMIWADYDPQRKSFKGQPQLPSWALPGGRQTQRQQQQAAPPPPPPQPANPQQAPQPQEDPAVLTTELLRELQSVKTKAEYEVVANKIKLQKGVLGEANLQKLRELCNQVLSRFTPPSQPQPSDSPPPFGVQ
jgi:hypothetical protein